MRGEVACGTPVGLPGFWLSLGAAPGPALSFPAAPMGSAPLAVSGLPGWASLPAVPAHGARARPPRCAPGTDRAALAPAVPGTAE